MRYKHEIILSYIKNLMLSLKSSRNLVNVYHRKPKYTSARNPRRYYQKHTILQTTKDFRDDLLGTSVAAIVLANWTAAFSHAMWNVECTDVLQSSLAFLWLEFACTGLFITAHDSMHGSIAPNVPKLNEVFGVVCSLLYAGFWMNTELLPSHSIHHIHPGKMNIDPDFHDDGKISLKWYTSFMKSYISVAQFIRLQIMILFMMYGPFHAPPENLLMIWAPAGIISSLRLWYFGTAKPHSVSPEISSTNATPFKAFLECYGFGYHKEHHDNPTIPWWKLLLYKTKTISPKAVHRTKRETEPSR